MRLSSKYHIVSFHFERKRRGKKGYSTFLSFYTSRLELHTGAEDTSSCDDSPPPSHSILTELLTCSSSSFRTSITMNPPLWGPTKRARLWWCELMTAEICSPAVSSTSSSAETPTSFFAGLSKIMIFIVHVASCITASSLYSGTGIWLLGQPLRHKGLLPSQLIGQLQWKHPSYHQSLVQLMPFKVTMHKNLVLECNSCGFRLFSCSIVRRLSTSSVGFIRFCS